MLGVPVNVVAGVILYMVAFHWMGKHNIPFWQQLGIGILFMVGSKI